MCKRLLLYSNADSDADDNAEKPMPRYPNGLFHIFCQFRMEKKKLAVGMETLYEFPYF